MFNTGDLIEGKGPHFQTKGRVLATVGEDYKIFWINSQIIKVHGKDVIEEFYQKVEFYEDAI